MSLHFRIASLLIAVGMLTWPADTSPAPDQGRLIATPEILSQEYCFAEHGLFEADLVLRVTFENDSDKVLILDKQLGKFADPQIIAKSSESLAQREYEVDPIFDSFGLDKDPPNFKPTTRLLRSKFVLLPPGKSFESETRVVELVSEGNWPSGKGVLSKGKHILLLGFDGWSHSVEASPFAKAWRTYGELVTEMIYASPIEFQIPQNPEFGKTCNLHVFSVSTPVRR